MIDIKAAPGVVVLTLHQSGPDHCILSIPSAAIDYLIQRLSVAKDAAALMASQK